MVSLCSWCNARDKVNSVYEPVNYLRGNLCDEHFHEMLDRVKDKTARTIAWAKNRGEVSPHGGLQN